VPQSAQAPASQGALGIDAAIALLSQRGVPAVKPLVPELTLKLMPLLRLIERESQANFRLSKLKERALAAQEAALPKS
jgi:hypothetical protein